MDKLVNGTQLAEHFKVSRNTIYKWIKNNIGYITISSFSATTSEQFIKKLESLEKEKINSLIIDVRDNPDGKLGQVNKILDEFVANDYVGGFIDNNIFVKMWSW